MGERRSALLRGINLQAKHASCFCKKNSPNVNGGILLKAYDGAYNIDIACIFESETPYLINGRKWALCIEFVHTSMCYDPCLIGRACGAFNIQRNLLRWFLRSDHIGHIDVKHVIQLELGVLHTSVLWLRIFFEKHEFSARTLTVKKGKRKSVTYWHPCSRIRQER